MSKIDFILRKDLNLNKYWWHRFIKIIFILSILYFFIQILDDSYYKYYSIVSNIESRLTNNLIILNDLPKEGEFLSDYLSGEPGGSVVSVYSDNTYCSLKIKEHIDKILSFHPEVSFFMDRGHDLNNYLKKEEFVLSLEKSNYYCVNLDSFTSENYKKIYFLNTFDSNYFNDLNISVFNPLKTYSYFVGVILLSLIGICLFAITLYHVFLYIVFGRYKNN